MKSPLHIQPLDASRHDRAGFDCGIAELNYYLQKTANQDVKKGAAGCWVVLESPLSQEILGYYTLSPEAVETVDLPDLPSKIKKKLPRYQRVGAVLLGRLAVSQKMQGQRLGERLMFDALNRCLASDIPYVVVVVDPKDEKAAGWYERFGFYQLTQQRMFITIQELKLYFQSSG